VTVRLPQLLCDCLTVALCFRTVISMHVICAVTHGFVLQADVVFLSPPWGGPLYLSQPVFGVEPRLGSMSQSLGDLLRR
jgi:RNA cap guanine-N2 methyltransferase